MMRLSKLFSQTLRESPADVDSPSLGTLIRAGYIYPSGTGVFSFLPLGQRTIAKIEQVLRAEIHQTGAQEISIPQIRLEQELQNNPDFPQIKELSNHKLIARSPISLVDIDLIRRIIRSHRQLPSQTYHISKKMRDEIPSRPGLFHAKEFTQFESVSMDANWEGLQTQLQENRAALTRVFQRCGVDVTEVADDPGIFGDIASSWMYLSPQGDETLAFCTHCGYTANQNVAHLTKPFAAEANLLPLQQVATPQTTTIAALAEYLTDPTRANRESCFLHG